MAELRHLSVSENKTITEIKSTDISNLYIKQEEDGMASVSEYKDANFSPDKKLCLNVEDNLFFRDKHDLESEKTRLFVKQEEDVVLNLVPSLKIKTEISADESNNREENIPDVKCLFGENNPWKPEFKEEEGDIFMSSKPSDNTGACSSQYGDENVGPNKKLYLNVEENLFFQDKHDFVKQEEDVVLELVSSLKIKTEISADKSKSREENIPDLKCSFDENKPWKTEFNEEEGDIFISSKPSDNTDACSSEYGDENVGNNEKLCLNVEDNLFFRDKHDLESEQTCLFIKQEDDDVREIVHFLGITTEESNDKDESNLDLKCSVDKNESGESDLKEEMDTEEFIEEEENCILNLNENSEGFVRYVSPEVERTLNEVFSLQESSEETGPAVGKISSQTEYEGRSCLPRGWTRLIHVSGVPLYFHQESSVCSWSQPYRIDENEHARTHEVPLSAIPCLAYKRELEKRKESEEEKNESQSEENTTTGTQKPLRLKASELREYCTKLFAFVQNSTEANYRLYTYYKKNVPLQNPNNLENECVISAQNRNLIILELHALEVYKRSPYYVFKTLELPETQFLSNVYIGNVVHGTGIGKSKEEAKQNAAKSALDVFIPQMAEKIQFGNTASYSGGTKLSSPPKAVSLFDEITIDDPRVNELSGTTNSPTPYEILLICLKTIFGNDDFRTEWNVLNDGIEFTMKVDKHIVKVVDKNIIEGRQRAAQAMLQELHPEVKTWGSMIRLYGRVKKTKPQNKAYSNGPNYAVLNKLKEEMIKLSKKKQEKK